MSNRLVRPDVKFRVNIRSMCRDFMKSLPDIYHPIEKLYMIQDAWLLDKMGIKNIQSYCNSVRWSQFEVVDEKKYTMALLK